MKINKYGVDWDVNYSGKSRTILLKNTGVCFVCDLGMDAFRGPHLVIYSLQKDLEHMYRIEKHFRFYSKELEPFYDDYRNNMLYKEWYHILQRGYTFPKSLFKPYEDAFRMSITTALNRDKTTTPQDVQIVSNLFLHTRFPPNFTVTSSKGRDFIVVSEQIYEQLPAKWTVHDIEKLIQPQVYTLYRVYEQPWQEIAECRAKNKPVRIQVQENRTGGSIIFTERKTPYGVKLATVLPKSTNYFSAEEERSR